MFSFSNPLTEERLEQLQTKANEFLRKFQIHYAKNYGYAVFLDGNNESHSSNNSSSCWRLSRRPFNSVPRSYKFSGMCYMKEGPGPGAFGKWQERYLSERQDYSIDVFAGEQDFQSGGNPKFTISTAGYDVEKHTSQHYQNELDKLAAGLGLTEIEKTALATFSDHSWALTHDNRTNYIVQLHKGSNSICCCCPFLMCMKSGSDSDDADAANQRRPKWIEFARRCVGRAEARDSEVALGKAFDMTCSDMVRLYEDELRDWNDEGTEEEMLTSLLMAYLLPGLRNEMLSEISGPVGVKLTVWYKIRSVIQTTLEGLARPAWFATKTSANAIQIRLDPIISPMRVKINGVLKRIDGRLNNVLLSKIDNLLSNSATNIMRQFIDAYQQPLKVGMMHGRDVFRDRVDVENLPVDKSQRNVQLDAIPRTPGNVREMVRAARDVVEPLKAINFDGEMDVDDLCLQAEYALLEMLDAAVYTLELRLDDGETANPRLKQTIANGYDADEAVARRECVRTAMRETFICYLKKMLAPAMETATAAVNEEIPEDMQEFLSADQIVDGFIDRVIGARMDSLVNSAFQLGN